MTGKEFIIELLAFEEAGDPEFQKQRVAKIAKALERFWNLVLRSDDQYGRGTRPADEIIDLACIQDPDSLDEFCDRVFASKRWVRLGIAVMLSERQSWELLFASILEALREHFSVPHPHGSKPRPPDWNEHQLYSKLVEHGILPVELLPPAQGSPEHQATYRALLSRVAQLKLQCGGTDWRFHDDNYPGGDAKRFHFLRRPIVEGRLDGLLRHDEIEALRGILYERDSRREYNFELEHRGELAIEQTDDGFLFWRSVRK